MDAYKCIKELQERIELIDSDYPKMKEYKNALETAIKAIKKIEKIKQLLGVTCLSDDFTKCLYDGNCKLHERDEIAKVVRSDEC